MARTCDVVVVGAGHNGLTAAAYLAKSGLDVCVVEKKPYLGGATCTVECTLPGFRHDVGGTIHSVIQNNPLLRNDELGLFDRFGLQYVRPDIYAADIFPDGSSSPVYRDLEATCEEIARFCPADARAYREFIAWCMPMLPLLHRAMFSPPPGLGAMMAFLDGSREGRELIRVMFMSAWDIARQWFRHPKMLMKIMKLASEPMINPEEKGTGVYLLTIVPAAHAPNGAGLCVGGSGELAAALSRALQAHGGTVVTDFEVTRIIADGGEARGVVSLGGEEIHASRCVIANVDPRIALDQWLAEDVLDPGLRRRIRGIEDAGFSGFMIAAALDEAPRYKGDGRVHEALFVEPLPADLSAFREMFHDLKMGRLPAPAGMAPFVVVPTEHDPSRAPAGKHVLYLWHYVPYALADGGKDGWLAAKDRFADQLQEHFFSFTTNMTPAKVLKRTCYSPVDLETFNSNLFHGNILGPGGYLHQMFAYRPIPELGQYATPISRLYLCGMSMHPGGAITGGGRAVAQKVMADLGIDFEDVVHGST